MNDFTIRAINSSLGVNVDIEGITKTVRGITKKQDYRFNISKDGVMLFINFMVDPREFGGLEIVVKKIKEHLRYFESITNGELPDKEVLYILSAIKSKHNRDMDFTYDLWTRRQLNSLLVSYIANLRKRHGQEYVFKDIYQDCLENFIDNNRMILDKIKETSTL